MKVLKSLLIQAFMFIGITSYSQWTISGNNIYNTNSGNVGIGIATPGYLLHVAKNMTSPSIRIQNLGGEGGAAFEMIDNLSSADWKFKATTTGGFKIRDHASGLDVITIEKNSGANAIYIKQGGSIGIGTTAPENSALMEINSTTKGFLPPRLTLIQLNAIQDPTEGLMVFCTDCGINGALSIYMGGSWYKLSVACLNPTSPIPSDPIPTATVIQWNWNAVDGAIGYKWNTVNDYYTALDVGANTYKTETGLVCNTSYSRFIWAYNSSCFSESAVLTGSTSACPGACDDVPEISYGGQTYNTVQIGTQCWLRENLNLGTQIDGLSNPADNGIVEKYCYNDLASNCELYGGLYQFSEMMEYNNEPGSRGICPVGWHVPTDEEWCTLSLFVDDEVNCNTLFASGVDAGIKMKASSGWIDNGNGTNETGFTALPGGVRYTTYYDGIGWASDIWTSTTTSTPGAYYRVFGSTEDGIGRYNSAFSSQHGFAVRCIKNN